MAITIQDLIASDTISQAVDKINFNLSHFMNILFIFNINYSKLSF